MPLRVRLPQPRSQAARWCRPSAGAHQHLLNSLPGSLSPLKHALGATGSGSNVLATAVWLQGSGCKRQVAADAQGSAACGSRHSVLCLLLCLH